MRKYSKKLLAFVMTAILATGFYASGVEAATLNWHLRYVKGAPSSENIYSWSPGYVYTTTSTTTMKVSNMNGNATVYVYTSNGISSMFSTNGSVNIKTTKNTKMYAVARFSDYGSGNSNPSGSLIY